jgi:hypothetical protein
MRNEILLTDGDEVGLSEIVGRIAAHCGGVWLVDEQHPIFRVFLVAHWSLAEMQTFRDFNYNKTRFDSVRGTYITKGRPMRFAPF